MMIEINKPVFFWALAVLGIAVYLAGGQLFYLFFYLTFLFFLVPLLWLKLGINKLKGKVTVSAEYGEVDREIEVSYFIVNSQFGFFPYLELANMVSGSFNSPSEGKFVALPAGYEASFTRMVKCTRRGIYDLETFQVKTGDPFGLFKLSRPLSSGIEIKVYPRVKKIPGVILPARQRFGNIRVKEHQFENYTHISYLREWQEGDNAKRIHWKQSARQRRLVVKNYELTGDASLNIFLDMNVRSYSNDEGHLLEDLAVESAASIIYLSLQDKIAVNVFSEPLAVEMITGHQLRDYRLIMDRIISLAPTGKSSFVNYVNHLSYSLTPKSSLYLFTPHVGIEEATLFLTLKQKGFYPVVFYLALNEGDAIKNKMLDKLRESGLDIVILFAREAGTHAV